MHAWPFATFAPRKHLETSSPRQEATLTELFWHSFRCRHAFGFEHATVAQAEPLLPLVHSWPLAAHCFVPRRAAWNSHELQDLG